MLTLKIRNQRQRKRGGGKGKNARCTQDNGISPDCKPHMQTNRKWRKVRRRRLTGKALCFLLRLEIVLQDGSPARRQ